MISATIKNDSIICNICGNILNKVYKNNVDELLNIDIPIQCPTCYTRTNYFPINNKKTIEIKSDNKYIIKQKYKRKLSYGEELTKKWQKSQHRNDRHRFQNTK